MAISEPYTGTEAIGNDEWSLTSDTTTLGAITDDGIYQCFLDLSDMVAGDIVTFRIYEKVRSADTQRVCFAATFGQAQGADSAIWVSPSLVLLHGWEMSLIATSGTVTIQWSIRKIA